MDTSILVQVKSNVYHALTLMPDKHSITCLENVPVECTTSGQGHFTIRFGPKHGIKKQYLYEILFKTHQYLEKNSSLYDRVVINNGHIDVNVQSHLLIEYTCLRLRNPSFVLFPCTKKSTTKTMIIFETSGQEQPQATDLRPVLLANAIFNILNCFQHNVFMSEWTYMCSHNQKNKLKRQSVYFKLGVHHVQHGQKLHDDDTFYESCVPVVLQDLKEKGLLQVLNNGNTIRLKHCDLILKSNRVYSRAMLDLTVVHQHLKRDKITRFLYVASHLHAPYLKTLFQTALVAKWIHDTENTFRHVEFKDTNMDCQKKTSTETTSLQVLFEQVNSYGNKMMEGVTTVKKTAATCDLLARNSLVYQCLLSHPTQAGEFSLDRMFHGHENTFRYIQCTCSRYNNVVDECRLPLVQLLSVVKQTPPLPLQGFENEFAFQLTLLDTLLNRLVESFHVHRFISYVFHLCQMANEYANTYHVHIESTCQKNVCLLLSVCFLSNVKICLDVLGIPFAET